LPATDLALITDAAIAGGEIARKFFGASPEVWDKPGGQGPVTEADLAIDRMLKAELLAARPDYGWLSEETEDSAERLSCDRVFIVDPIDGTRAFMNGEHSFGVSIAVAERGRIIAGAFAMPVAEKLYAAALGAGATKNGTPVAHSGRTGIEDASLLVQRSQMKPELWPRGLPALRQAFRPSLAYRICLVAEGRFDAMLTLRPAHEWDIAAAGLICREAGGRVTDLAGAELCYNSETALQPGLIAATPVIHDYLKALI